MKSRLILCGIVLMSLVVARTHAGIATVVGAPIPIKVVIVTTFEEDYDNPNATGDTPGEAVAWIKGLHLDKVIPLPAGFRPVRMNDDGVLELMTGMTTGKAAASTMALGLDPRFDFSKTYWILAGIAGIDPKQASIGSAAWAEWIVDGDIANFIDPREIPPSWPDGHIPWDQTSPFGPLGSNIGQLYRLNPELVHWAFNLTKDVAIPDSDGMKKFRARFQGYPQAQRPPFVLIGDNLASATYWQGAVSTDWARRWVKLYTQGKGTFTTTACEDSGFMQSMTLLAKAGRVDLRRVLSLRTASDYCMPIPGVTAVESLQYGTDKAYMALSEAAEAAYVVGSPVVNELVRGWTNYRQKVPSFSEKG
jgi:purine nucleoside permease